MRLLLPAVAAVAMLIVPAPALSWSWPVHGSVLTLFSFERQHPYAAGQHRGIDIGAPTGTEVEAPVSGSVAFAGTVPVGGKTLTIATPDGYSVTLVHLGSYAVRRGDAVSEGEVVGAVGPSGQYELTVPYVYLGVRRTDDPQGYLDPLAFLPAQGPPPSPGPGPEPAPQPVPVPDPVGGPAPPGVPSRRPHPHPRRSSRRRARSCASDTASPCLQGIRPCPPGRRCERSALMRVPPSPRPPRMLGRRALRRPPKPSAGRGLQFRPYPRAGAVAPA